MRRPGDSRTTARKQTRRPEIRLLATHHDGEHVADFLAGAILAHQVDLDDLAPRLGRFAHRFGLPAGDGPATPEHLLELGDVNHEVHSAALAPLARSTGLAMSTYIEQLRPIRTCLLP